MDEKIMRLLTGPDRVRRPVPGNPKIANMFFDENTGILYGREADSGNTHVLSEPRLVAEYPNKMERFGKGMDDIFSGAKQAYLFATDPEEYGAFTRDRDKDLAVYDRALYEMGVDGIDWPALGGEAVATAPVGAAQFGTKLLPRAISGALQGGTATGLGYTPESDRGFLMDRAMNTGVGMVGGGAVPPALSLGKNALAGTAYGAARTLNALRAQYKPTSSIRRQLSEEIPQFESLGERVQALVMADARAQLETSGRIDAQALERKLRAEGLGFTGDRALTTGQTTRDPRLWGREQELAKMEGGEALRGRFTAQNRRLTEELREELPRSVIAREDANNAVISAVNQKWDDMQKGVSRVYRMIENRYGDATVDEGLPSLERYLVDEMADPNNTVAQAAYNKGVQMGLFGDELKPVTLKNVEAFRKWIGRRSDKNEPELKRAKRLVIDALDDDVIETFGDDLFKTARDKARGRFQEFSTSLLDRVVQGKADETNLYRWAMSAPLADLQQLKYVLNTPVVRTGTDEITGNFVRGKPFKQGEEAWNALRSKVLDEIWAKAAPDGGDGGFKRASYRNALDGIGRKKLELLFGKDDTAKLYAIKDASRDMLMEPPYSGMNYSNTSSALYNILSRVPTLGEVGRGLQEGATAAANAADVERAIASQPGTQLRFDEVVSNMDALGMSPLGKMLSMAAQAGPPSGGLLFQSMGDER